MDTNGFDNRHPAALAGWRGQWAKHRLYLSLVLAGIPGMVGAANFDVIVVGAGGGGVAAAIQAARLGARVALLEETDWIGGQMTAAGVSTMDGGSWSASGIYEEFIGKVRAHYAALGKSVSTCYNSNQSVCFEPRVGQSILRDMLKKYPQIELFQRQAVVGLMLEGKRVTGVVAHDGKAQSTGLGINHKITRYAQVVIDATEYGDLLPFLPAPYRIGIAASDRPKPDACVQDITYTAIVRKYPNGVPDALRMKNPPPGYALSRDKFAAKVAPDGGESMDKLPVNWAIHNAYRGLPDSAMPGSYTGWQPALITRTGINMANDFPVKVDVFDRSRRKAVQCAAKLHTLQFLYYMQHDLGQTAWGVANDEGYDTPYNREENNCAAIPAEFKAIERQMPPLPYVRESRRMVGVHTLTAREIKRVGSPPRGAVRFPTSVAVGDYPVDLHDCWNLEKDLDRLEDLPKWTPGPFEIPMESFIPSTVDGFVAAEKNLSQSRYVNGATRLQPITMMTGQAAGAIAALAARGHLQPRDLPFPRVRDALLAAGLKINLDAFRDRLGSRP